MTSKAIFDRLHNQLEGARILENLAWVIKFEYLYQKQESKKIVQVGDASCRIITRFKLRTTLWNSSKSCSIFG